MHTISQEFRDFLLKANSGEPSYKWQSFIEFLLTITGKGKTYQDLITYSYLILAVLPPLLILTVIYFAFFYKKSKPLNFIITEISVDPKSKIKETHEQKVKALEEEDYTEISSDEGGEEEVSEEETSEEEEETSEEVEEEGTAKHSVRRLHGRENRSKKQEKQKEENKEGYNRRSISDPFSVASDQTYQRFYNTDNRSNW
jgi:hypothetical protein